MTQAMQSMKLKTACRTDVFCEPSLLPNSKSWVSESVSVNELKGHNWVHFAHRLLVYCYLEFRFHYLKNLKLFSIRVKELFEPIVLQKKSWWVFALFKSIFLRNRYLSTTRQSYGKKRKIKKGKPYLTENWLSKNEMWCAADNHNDTCLVCAKELLDLNFN